jgi:hypothetical protein
MANLDLPSQLRLRAVTRHQSHHHGTSHLTNPNTTKKFYF